MAEEKTDAPPPIELRFLSSMAEQEAALARMNPGRPLLLVFKASWCPNCPAFGEAVAELVTKYQFDYYYTDAEERELVDEHAVTKLPAFVLWAKPDAPPRVVSPASVEAVQASIAQSCTPVLDLDADF